MDERLIPHLYSWVTNEYILVSWVLTLALMGTAVALLWALRLLCVGRGPGRWAATILDRLHARREQTGNWFGFTPAYAWHHRQVIRFQLLYVAFIVCTCGVGLIVGAPFYIWWFIRAQDEVRAGGWPLLPVVGRWQPPPPMDHAAP